MKEYKIEIVETLTREVIVTASCEEYAIKIVRDRYMDGEEVLDSRDYAGVDFNLIEVSYRRRYGY